ncbi:MFS transporter [Piscirickettsia salmonis]|nr:MFS transporter [Piscirickettsia salmonis]
MSHPPNSNHRLAFFLIIPAFFAWGLIVSLNALLIPQLQTLFHLDYATSMLVQSFYFAACGFFAIPMTKLILKIGYQQSIVFGFAVTALGCISFIPASYFNYYIVYLIGIFIISTGVVMLEVASNPYVSLLGQPEKSSSRLTFAQAFTGAGFVTAPLLATLFLLKPGNIAHHINITYSLLAIALLLLSTLAFLSPMPALHQQFKIKKSSHSDPSSQNKAQKRIKFKESPRLWLGCLALFIDCGLEMSISSFLLRFIQSVTEISTTQAAHHVTLFWLLFLAGRFAGGALLHYIRSPILLGLLALSGSSCIALAITTHNPHYAIAFMLITGLCNSILFPTIFSEALKGLGKKTPTGSAYLSTAITGGAITPLLQGVFADVFSLHSSFLIPLISCLAIFSYALYLHYDDKQRQSLLSQTP